MELEVDIHFTGQIVKVNQNNSVAQLVFDKNFKMGAKIKRSNIYGVLTGNNPGPPMTRFSLISALVITAPEFISDPVAGKVKTVPKTYHKKD